MSIFAYTGLPGSGKSYSVVEHQVLPALKAGRLVVTNLPLKRDLICADLGIDPGMLREFPAEAIAAEPDRIFDAAPSGCVLVLDEVWRMFPAGLKANKVPEAFRTVFAEHRHRVDASGASMQIVLVTQDLAQISAFARQLVETTFRTSKLSTLGLNTRYRVDIFNGPVSGPNPPVSSAIRQSFGRYRKEVWRYYTSHTQSQSDQDGADEAAVDKRANIFLRPMMIAAPFVIVGLIWWGVSRLWHDHDAIKNHAGAGALASGGSQAPGGVHESSGVDGARRPVGKAVVVERGVHVLVEVEYRRDPARSKVILADGERLVEVPASQCVKAGRYRQCLYRGDYYDSVGWVRHAVAGPAGAWTVAQTAPGG